MGRHKKPLVHAITEYLPTAGAAKHLDVTVQELSRLVNNKTLTAYLYDAEAQVWRARRDDEKRKGQTYYFFREELDDYKKNHRQRGRPEGAALTPRQRYLQHYYQTHKKQTRTAEKKS